MKRLLVSFIIAALSISIVGCTNTGKSGENGNTADGIYTPGTYTATAQGYGGEVKVTITVDGNSIKEVKTEGAQETEEIGGEALKELADKIVGSNSTEVDKISGATYTSDALLSAVNSALALAKGEEQGEKVVADGKYTVEVIGHEGTIVVATMFDNQEIKSVEVVSQSETQGIGTYATKDMPGRIVEAQSINVDSISGATVTSNAVKQAVSQAIVQAGGDVAKYSVAPEKPEVVKQEVEENVQVAIMGAGTELDYFLL